MVAAAQNRSITQHAGDSVTFNPVGCTPQLAGRVETCVANTTVSSTTTSTVATTTTVPATTTTSSPVGSWPDGSNTGPHGTLTVINGNWSSDFDGQTLSNVDVRGIVTITHDNVTISNCHVQGLAIDGPVIRVYGKNALIRDCDIGTSSGWAGGSAVGDGGFTLLRVNIHNTSDGVRCDGCTISDSWIHDLYVNGADHNDGVQRYAGAGTDVIRHNRIEAPPWQNAAIFYADNWQGTLTLDNNLLSGGGYTLRIHESGSATVTNNTIVVGSYSAGPTNFACTNMGSISGCTSLGTVSPYSGNKLSDGTPL